MSRARVICAAAALVAGCVLASERPALDSVDGERALAFLTAQTDLGPRAPGTAGHEAGLRYLVETLRALVDTVETMRFQPMDSHGRRLPPMANIIGRIRPDAQPRYLLCAHWDTRPRADRDPDPARRDDPIVGANDGASGVAVLMEVASVLRDHTPPVGVDIVLFDGEDWGEEGSLDDYFLGSREYAAQRWSEEPELGILVDMVGDADLHIPVERLSWQTSPDLVSNVWRVAEDIGVDAFDARVGRTVYDDHLPLVEIGWSVIDIIDFDYPYWHTHSDTPDKCSSESLESVAKVLVAVIHGY